ncbi:hypothetical protein BGX28_005020 [Mortierella sp. GBA30]|nr:hypothetical protein BGX28_005020 [Mortierella sp. GBA30]
MENFRWTTSPEQSLQLRYGSQGLDEDDEEGEESRLELTFDALDADIHLDNSVRTNPRLNSYSGHASSAGMTDSSEGTRTQKTIDRWSASTGKPATMTLKEQEKVIDELKKETFNLKVKVYFLEDRLAKMSPEHVDQALNENVDLKVRLQKMHSDMKQYKQLLEEAHAALEALRAQKDCDLQHGMTEEQEDEYRNAITEALDLKATLKQLSGRIDSLEKEAKAKDLELEDLHSRLGELDMQANTIEDLKELTSKYEGQITQLHDRLTESEQNESRLMEKSRADEGWEARCRELEQELDVSLRLRSELEHELSLTRSEKSAVEADMNDMNYQLELHRDELSKAKIEIEKLSRQLNEERDQMRQVQETQANDMRTFSSMNMELEDIRKAKDQLDAQAQDLLAWRKEDAARHDQDVADLLARHDQHVADILARHDQELADLVGELDDKEIELDRLQQELGNSDEVLQEKDMTIAELQDRIDELERITRDGDAVHEEIVASLRAKIQSSAASKVDTASVSLHDLRRMSADLELIEERNLRLESQLRLERDQRISLEASSRDRDSNGIRRWNDEREELERDYSDRIQDLQNELATASEQVSELNQELTTASEQISELNQELDERDKQLQRYEEIELRLNSNLAETEAELMDLRQEVKQSKAARVLENARVQEKTELLHSRSHEVDRLNIKTRKLNDTMAALEGEKEELENTLRDRETTLRDKATTIAMLNSRLKELELQLSKKQRDEDASSECSKSDLVERNSLLLTVLQHLETILGGDSRLDGNMLPKPSANFVYFSNHLISRLKSLSRLFILFEKKGRELEDKTTGQLVHLKKQLDLKLKQMDRFETIVRNAADRQRKWREQLVRKQAENEELQTSILLQNKAIADLKARSGSNERIQDYETRYKQVEIRLQVEKKRAVDAEERWNARLRELERRTKEAEEGVKRERQGAKEKLAALQDVNRAAQKTIENLQQQNDRLQRLVT